MRPLLAWNRTLTPFLGGGATLAPPGGQLIAFGAGFAMAMLVLILVAVLRGCCPATTTARASVAPAPARSTGVKWVSIRTLGRGYQYNTVPNEL